MKTFRIEYNVNDSKYYLSVFSKTALNEDGWLLVDASARKDTLLEKAKSFCKLQEKEEYFTFSPDYDIIPVTNPFEG